jgi:hypothetical protein
MPDYQQITLSVLAIIIILDKFAILDRLPFMNSKNEKDSKNENGKTDSKKLADEVAEVLATNHLHDLIANSSLMVENLKRIEEAIRDHDKTETPILQEITKDLVYLKAKQKNGQ